jgi:transcription initiation factor TFIID subunit 13
MSVATKKGRLQTEDVLFVIRKDRKKYGRVLSLLTMNEELKKARKAFELEAEEKETGKV